MRARSVVRRLRRRRGTGGSPAPTVPACFDDDERALVERCRPYTMVTPERLIATVDSVEHVVRRGIPGALVECGVWRGGSVLAMVLTLQRLGVDDRDVFLCDTFAGMTEPTGEDTSAFDPPAVGTFERARAGGERAWSWLFGDEVFGLEQVQELITATGYPRDRLHFVVGPVEETLPEQAPEQIAVLRLDTDWYASTKHELETLYPRLSPGGVLIIDDYGHWEGSRQAFDEYFAAGDRPLLARTDYTGRLGIKA